MGADGKASTIGGRRTGKAILRTLAGWMLACVALAAFCSSAFAATGTIEGTVADASSHAPLENVDVVAYDSVGDFTSLACTQTDGTYQLTGLDPGSYRVGFATANGACATGANFLPQFYNGKSLAGDGRPRVCRIGGHCFQHQRRGADGRSDHGHGDR
jgi:Carboxypeptidase regulatory-like domain